MKFYFLFGEEACRIYYEDGEVGRVGEGEFEIFLYNIEYNFPSELLEAFNGWEDYAEISEHQYNYLLKIKNNEE